MALSDMQRTQAVATLRFASDEYLRLPLWEFHPHLVPLVLSARRRSQVLQHDPEPTGDPEYT